MSKAKFVPKYKTTSPQTSSPYSTKRNIQINKNKAQTQNILNSKMKRTTYNNTEKMSTDRKTITIQIIPRQ